MPIERNLGKKCKHTDRCPWYEGNGIPDDMDKTIWRNVFCYRGKAGWSNCKQYHLFETEKSKSE